MTHKSAIMKKRYTFQFFILVLFISTWSYFMVSCKPADIGSKPSNAEYYNRTNQVDADYINDIQYRSAYKFDNNGKQYKKHYRKKKKDKD